MENQTKFDEVIGELRHLIMSVAGVKSFDETVRLEYVVIVDQEKDRENVEKVMSTLATQGKQHKIFIEATVVTQEELDKARQMYADHVAKETKFDA